MFIETDEITLNKEIEGERYWKTGFRSKVDVLALKKAEEMKHIHSQPVALAKDPQGYFHVYVRFTPVTEEEAVQLNGNEEKFSSDKITETS